MIAKDKILLDAEVAKRDEMKYHKYKKVYPAAKQLYKELIYKLKIRFYDIGILFVLLNDFCLIR